jgi:BON domain
MAITKRLVKTVGLTAGVIGVVAASAPGSVVGRAARRIADRLGRDVRYTVASAPGILYRLAGRSPEPNVSDDVLADRIRSSLGPLEHRLDVPRVHVIVEDHVAIVHGDVPDEGAACAIERAIMRISGVKGVESHLHPGLVAGDTRPSRGAAVPQPPSAALSALLDAARDAGAGRYPRAAVHAVLCGFTDRVPEHERVQVLAHLPSDVPCPSPF